MAFDPKDPSPAFLPIQIPVMLLPKPGIDLHRWCVIACDQHTTDLDYWQKTARIAGDGPSALHLVLPEIYLQQESERRIESRIAAINAAMQQYEQQKIVQTMPPGCVALDRQTPYHESRKGLLLAIDLEAYDHHPQTTLPIRASEGTVLERIPPRMAIRKDAPLELPHIQLLFDDPQNQLFDSLFASLGRKDDAPLYDTDLMQGGGHVQGTFLPDGDPRLSAFFYGLARLFSRRQDGLLFAVGDGNHSLATAKAHWDQIKSGVSADHPARHALVEIMNLHDPGLSFEPIHRVVFGQDADAVLARLRRYRGDLPLESRSVARPARLQAPPQEKAASTIQIVGPQKLHEVAVPSGHGLAAEWIQSLLDRCAAEEGWQIDYVHGEAPVAALSEKGHAGILLPALSKEDFFPLLSQNGILPRKTFSLGHACEKRYYMECRRIR